MADRAKSTKEITREYFDSMILEQCGAGHRTGIVRRKISNADHDSGAFPSGEISSGYAGKYGPICIRRPDERGSSLDRHGERRRV